MKTRFTLLRLLAMATAMVALLAVMAAQSDRPAEISTREAMRAKLGYAHKVLEGIATENYSQIETNAQKLARLAQLAGWRARQTPEYELFTNEFRRQADALVDAAQHKNLDGATLSYMHLTFSCVSCHKHMRGVKVAKLAKPIPLVAYNASAFK